jgi:hypothetical protein
MTLRIKPVVSSYPLCVAAFDIYAKILAFQIYVFYRLNYLNFCTYVRTNCFRNLQEAVFPMLRFFPMYFFM